MNNSEITDQIIKGLDLISDIDTLYKILYFFEPRLDLPEPPSELLDDRIALHKWYNDNTVRISYMYSALPRTYYEITGFSNSRDNRRD